MRNLDNLIKLRYKLGIRQKDIASFLGYSKSAYSNIENCYRDIDIDTLIILSYILDANILFLLGITPYNKTLDKNDKKHIKKAYKLNEEKIKKLCSNKAYDIYIKLEK